MTNPRYKKHDKIRTGLRGKLVLGIVESIALYDGEDIYYWIKIAHQEERVMRFQNELSFEDKYKD